MKKVFQQGLKVNEATTLSKLMDDVTKNNCPTCFHTLVDFKQFMLQEEEYEILRDLQKLEELHECPIPFIVRL
jgi:hypothetical protein